MDEVTYKIYLPFKFGVGNRFYGTKLTIKEFRIDDVFIKLTLDETGDEEKSFLIATTPVIDNNANNIMNEADIRIGKAVQSFFDGLSKAFSNAGFFNVFNGDTFLVNHEVYFRGSCSINPYNDSNKGFALDDIVVAKAIEYANSKDNFIKQAYFFLREAEYFVDIGRFSSAIIQFAIMTEHLINHVLSKQGLLNDKGYFKDNYEKECNKLYSELKDKINVENSFAYRKYIYGLSKLEMKLEDEIVKAIDIIYHLRNKLSHGHTTYEAFRLCNLDEITEYNIYDFMMTMTNYMADVYNYFVDNFK